MARFEDNKNPPTTPDNAPPVTAPGAPLAAKAAAPAAPAPKPNLTRDGIEVTLRAKFIAEGKSEEEATQLAKKRALEMIAE